MAESPTPPQGQETRAQLGAAAASPFMCDIPGYGPVPSSTYATYRKMLADPTIALARMVVRAPIEAGQWSFEARDDAPPGAVEFVQEVYESMRPQLVGEMLRALDFGWQGFEKIFEVKPWNPPKPPPARQPDANPQSQDVNDTLTPAPRIPGGLRMFVRHKSLLPELTEILLNKDTGTFEGLRQGKVELGADKCLVYTHDGEGDNRYGRSRLENLREVWSWWRECNDGAHRYDRKIAGVFPHVQYPMGTGRDASGAERPNYELALRLAENIAAGRPIVTPKLAAAFVNEEDINDPKAQAWVVSLLEDRGSRQPGFIERLKYLDSLKLRGYLRPERVALEGQHGTLAEAGEHGDLAITDGELLHADMARVINWHGVDQLLVLNYGEQARGSVYISPAPLRDTKRGLLMDLVKALMASPTGVELMLDWLDWDALFDLLGLPKAAEIIGMLAHREAQNAGLDDDAAAAIADAARTAVPALPTNGPMGDQVRKLFESVNGNLPER